MPTNVQAQSDSLAPQVSVIPTLPAASASVYTISDVITDTQIQELAYKLYEVRGRVDGNDQQDWFAAESILRERGKLAA